MSLTPNEVFLAFGKLICRIEGSRELLNSILRMKRYVIDKPQGENYKSIHICVITYPLYHEKYSVHGWAMICIEGVQYSVYSDDVGPIFALAFRDGKGDVIVYINELRRSCLRIALQFAVMLAYAETCVGIHGVTVIHNNETIILSAPSGTGKTTLAKLLAENYQSIVINGDFALLSFNEREGCIFEPTPFCGSSGRCLNQRLRVNRVIFLEQAIVNQWCDLNGREGLVSLMNNTYIPECNGSLAHVVRCNIAHMAANLPLSRFLFAPTTDAARLFDEMVTK